MTSALLFYNNVSDINVICYTLYNCNATLVHSILIYKQKNPVRIKYLKYLV